MRSGRGARGLGEGTVDDPHRAAAGEGLVLDQGEIGLDPEGVRIEHERNSPSRGQYTGLGIADAVLGGAAHGLIQAERAARAIASGRRACGRPAVHCQYALGASAFAS